MKWEADSEKTVIVKLTLNSREARELRALMQNPMPGDSDELKEVRSGIFLAIDSQLNPER